MVCKSFSVTRTIFVFVSLIIIVCAQTIRIPRSGTRCQFCAKDHPEALSHPLCDYRHDFDGRRQYRLVTHPVLQQQPVNPQYVVQPAHYHLHHLSRIPKTQSVPRESNFEVSSNLEPAKNLRPAVPPPTSPAPVYSRYENPELHPQFDLYRNQYRPYEGQAANDLKTSEKDGSLSKKKLFVVYRADADKDEDASSKEAIGVTKNSKGETKIVEGRPLTDRDLEDIVRRAIVAEKQNLMNRQVIYPSVITNPLKNIKKPLHKKALEAKSIRQLKDLLRLLEEPQELHVEKADIPRWNSNKLIESEVSVNPDGQRMADLKTEKLVSSVKSDQNEKIAPKLNVNDEFVTNFSPASDATADVGQLSSTATSTRPRR